MRKVAAGVAAALLLTGIASTCVAIYRIRRNLNALRRQVADEGNLAFTLTRLPQSSDPGPKPTFEPLAPTGAFTAGAVFAGKLYLAGPGGLAIYNNQSAQPLGNPRWLRTGPELPPAPIVALRAGRLRGTGTPLLLATTHGEGLLLISADPNQPIQQLLPADPAASDITAVLPLDSGDLLLGTRRAGLLLYNGTTLRQFSPALAQVSVTALAGGEGDLWIGTCARGVLHWHAGQLDAIGPGDNLPDPLVEDIAIGPEGVFVATPLGVAQITDGHLARVLAPGLFAHAIALDGPTLLIATLDQGVHAVPLDPHASTNVSSRPEARSAEVERPLYSPLAPTIPTTPTRFFSSGTTLFAIDTNGLRRRDAAGSWQTILSAPPQQLTDNDIAALSFSPDGRLWIGTFDRGIDVLNLETNRARHIEDEHVFCINRIVADPQRHTMDVATANGLVLFDAQRATARQVLTRRDGLVSDQITDIAFTRSGTALATPAGLTFLTASGAQSLYTFQGLANNHVYALSAEPDSPRVFAGTLGGVSILDGQTVLQNVTLRNSSLQRNWITAIARVPQSGDQLGEQDLWFVGTYGGGVVQMDAAGRVVASQNPAPNAVINPNALLRTAQHVFAGSLDDGLLVYSLSNRRWTQITAGLPSRNVTAFAARNGELYIGTANGIVRIAEARLP
jgi:ligand-binding sensor domain-containing protein